MSSAGLRSAGSSAQGRGERSVDDRVHARAVRSRASTSGVARSMRRPSGATSRSISTRISSAGRESDTGLLKAAVALDPHAARPVHHHFAHTLVAKQGRSAASPKRRSRTTARARAARLRERRRAQRKARAQRAGQLIATRRPSLASRRRGDVARSNRARTLSDVTKRRAREARRARRSAAERTADKHPCATAQRSRRLVAWHLARNTARSPIRAAR